MKQEPANESMSTPPVWPPASRRGVRRCLGGIVLAALSLNAALAMADAIQPIRGTPGPDSLIGTESRDQMKGLGGADQIEGMGNNDHIDGGRGNDWIAGGAAHDRLRGGPGADVIAGADGNDRIWGSRGNDRITSGSGADVIRCGPGRDRVLANANADTIRGCESRIGRALGGRLPPAVRRGAGGRRQAPSGQRWTPTDEIARGGR